MSSILKLENCYSWLLTDNENIKTILWKCLRFREEGYFHSRLYKQKRWDGYTDFFKKETGRFLTGLLPEVQLALNQFKIEYTTIDDRTDVSFKVPEIDEDFLPGLELYDYQVELINKAIKHKRGIIQAPTSAGKSAMMVGILKALPTNIPTLVIANRMSLVEQNYDAMIKYGIKNVGRVYDKYKEPNMFTCATVQSLHRIAPLLPKIKALIVDEVHDTMSKVPKKCYNLMKSCSVRIAVSATPFKEGGKDQCQKYSVKGHFGPIFTYKKGLLTTKKLQDRKILSNSICTFYPIDQPMIPYDIYQDAIENGIVNSYYFNDIVKRLVGKLSGRTLILVDRIAHGDLLQKMLGKDTVWIQGKDDLKTRKMVIKELQTGKGKKVAIGTQQIMSTGVNVFIHNLIIACSTKAEHLIIQRMGRGLRVADDKDKLYYWDFLFKINNYLEDHSKKRIKVLKKEGHEVIIKDNIDF